MRRVAFHKRLIIQSLERWKVMNYFKYSMEKSFEDMVRELE